MIKLLWLKLKSQRYLAPLFLLVLVFQLVMGQASSYVLTEQTPPMSLAVQIYDETEYGQKLVEALTSDNGFEIITAANNLSSDDVFAAHRVQGLLVVPDDFGSSIEDGDRAQVVFYPAPGVLNNDFSLEQIAGAIMQLRAQLDLDIALKKIGAAEIAVDDIKAGDLLDIEYAGAQIADGVMSFTPVYSVSALLLLLAFLHAALTVPTRSDKRYLTHGRLAFAKQTFASMVAVFLIWITIIAIYFAMMTFVLGVSFDAMVFLAFVAVVLYVLILGAALAQVMGRQACSWVFVPLFLLSMTLGGGLWANLSVTPLLSFLVPVTPIAYTGELMLVGIASLALASVAGLIVMLIRMALNRSLAR